MIMNYPKHVALIPDGNRTRAKEKGYSGLVGHMEGSKRVKELCKYIFGNTEIDVFTVWGLSSENLYKRKEEELDYLFDLYVDFAKSLFPFLRENNINLKWVGDKKGLNNNIVNFLEKHQKELTFKTNKYIVVAINYGGRNEILRGVNKVINDKDICKKDKIDEKEFEKYLDFYGLPNVDLLIRTKGGVSTRLSGYLLRRIGYAELYFTTLKCPEFYVKEFQKALQRFDTIAKYRNFGK